MVFINFNPEIDCKMKGNHPTVHFLWLFFCLFYVINISAQSGALARKGALGVRLEALTTTAAQAAKLPAGQQGAVITEVFPTGTGEALGLRAGDIVLSMAGDAVTDVQAVVRHTQSWRSGEPLRMEVWRNGARQQLHGTIKGKPMETSTVAEVTYGAVSFGDGQLRTIIHKPKADGVFPLVVYLQGFDCSSIDYYYQPDSPIRQFVDGLVEKGFAVFRVEKPGVGDSDGSFDCGNIGYDTEVAAFDAAMQELKDYDFVDTDNIFYFGHSLGGVTAPLLAARHHPKGVAVYGTVFESWYEYMQKVFRDQSYVRGDDWIRTENNSRNAQEFLARLFIMKESPEQMSQYPQLKSLLDGNILDFDGDSRFIGRHYTFWQELNAANQVQAWRDADVYSLAIYGEYDIHAISPKDAQQIADLVNDYHPGKGKFVLLPGTEHGFSKVPSMEAYVQMRTDGSFNSRYMAEHYNPAVVETLVNWMEDVMRTEGKKVGKR